MELQTSTIHGRRVAYRTAGSDGPLVVLIHGMTQQSSTWEELAVHMAGRARLLAIDLPGHGGSENPPGDHSLGAYASTVRDLLLTLGEEHATIVGHSLGGGVALQFAYQFPDMIDRLVLIDAGGLGREVSPILRAAALPGADPVIRLLSSDALGDAVASVARLLTRFGARIGTDLREGWRGLGGLADAQARRAFLRTIKATVGVDGQLVSAHDKLYLAAQVPTLLLWGARDRMIPLAHATAAHEAIPGSQLRVLARAGHFPHLDEPEAVAGHISQFLASTDATPVPRERWAEVLRASNG